MKVTGEFLGPMKPLYEMSIGTPGDTTVISLIRASRRLGYPGPEALPRI